MPWRWRRRSSAVRPPDGRLQPAWPKSAGRGLDPQSTRAGRGVRRTVQGRPRRPGRPGLRHPSSGVRVRTPTRSRQGRRVLPGCAPGRRRRRCRGRSPPDCTRASTTAAEAPAATATAVVVIPATPRVLPTQRVRDAGTDRSSSARPSAGCPWSRSATSSGDVGDAAMCPHRLIPRVDAKHADATRCGPDQPQEDP